MHCFFSALLLIGGSLGDIDGERKVLAAGDRYFQLRLSVVRRIYSPRSTHYGACSSGHWGGTPDSGESCAKKRFISANRTGPRNRHLVRWTSITAAAGPVLGSWLVQRGSWRWAFFINAPLAVVALLCIRHLPERLPNRQPTSLDWAGALLAALGLGGVVYASIESALALGVIGALSPAASVCVEATSRGRWFHWRCSARIAVNFENPNRAPLLLISGGLDHVSPRSVVEANYALYGKSRAVTDFKDFPDRTHYTLGQEGWEEVADYALNWLETQTRQRALSAA